MKVLRMMLTCVLILSFATFTYAQTVEEVIAKAIAAEGGTAKKAITILMSKGKVSAPMQGMEGDFLSYNKRPNKLHLKVYVQGLELVQATNGTVCWSLNPFMGQIEPTEMPADQAKAFIRNSDFDGYYYDMEAKGITAELVGKETVDDQEVYNVKFTYDDGDVKTLFFTTDTGLLFMSKEIFPGPMGEQEVVLTFSDYREVDGVKFPFLIKQSAGGMDLIIEVEEIKANVEVDDTLFEMPEPDKAAEEKPPSA